MAGLYEAFTQGRQQGEARKAKKTLADYMMPATRGDQNALAQVYSADPNAGMQAEKLGRQSQEDDLGNMVKAANMFLQTKDPQAYSYIRERTIKMRPELAGMPEALTTPEDQAGAEKFIQAFVGAYGGGESGNDLRSLRIGEDGNYYGIRGADLVNTGVRAAPNNRIVEGAGGFYGVNTSSLSARPINVGGGQPQTPQGDYGPSETDNYVRSIMGKVGNIDPNMPPEQMAETLLPHLIQQESGGNPNAVSPKGARGLTQVMPATGRDPGFGVAPIRDNSPQENVRFGRDYLTAMLRRYPGRPDLALAAYNSGPGAADKLTQGRQGQQLQGKPKEVSPLELARLDMDRQRLDIQRQDFEARKEANAVTGKPPTEDERKSAGYAVRMEDALRTMSEIEKRNPSDNRPGYGTAVIDMLPDALANDLKSDDRQILESAQLDGLDAALTLATGAAYTKEQLKSLSKSYFPQPNDSEAAITDKRRRLNLVIETARIRSGRAEGTIDQALNAPSRQESPTQPRRLKFNPATGKLE